VWVSELWGEAPMLICYISMSSVNLRAINMSIPAYSTWWSLMILG
jgi:hypothetical protein